MLDSVTDLSAADYSRSTPAKPVELRTPENLLARSQDIEVRDGRLVAKASANLGEPERAFFDRYQRRFSLGAGVFDQLWQAQQHWHELPLDIIATVRRMDARAPRPGEPPPYRRFPDRAAALDQSSPAPPRPSQPLQQVPARVERPHITGSDCQYLVVIHQRPLVTARAAQALHYGSIGHHAPAS